MSLLLMLTLGTTIAWGTDITSLSSISSDGTGDYIITADIDASSFTNSITNFTGTLTAQAKADGTFPVITGLKVPIFTTATGATISNIMFKSIAVTGSGPIGAICGTANGSTRIYNCGVLPTLTNTDNTANTGITYDEDGKITGFGSTVYSSDGNCGSLVGTLAGNARVINCFSYANITGGATVAGIVGKNTTTAITQGNVSTVGMVVNCMFYGDITGGTTKCPVYGGNMIKTNASNGVNPYCYFRANASFDDAYTQIDNYNRSWPADEEYLTRFEYYRSILNSNKRLCTYWVTDKVYGSEDAPTKADEALIAKWVLDPAIAPYPILKKWDKYPSIINPDKSKTIDPRLLVKDADGNFQRLYPEWKNRSTSNPYEGKSFTTPLTVTVNPGAKAPEGVTAKEISLPITDIDMLNYDYGYYKVQLPYYNEIFGNPTSNDHDIRYGGNYKDYVVTGWDITVANDAADFTGTRNNFVANWESGYNFADRNCKDKDFVGTSGRVFAQGGYYYVPEGVSSISITAHWGKAVYLHNKGHYIDRVNITSQSGDRKVGDPFTSAGTQPTTFQGQNVYDEWHTAVSKLDAATLSNGKLNKTVYDNAVVLLSNFQLKNGNGNMGKIDNKYYPHTMMSIDQDLDNEPDYCFEFQFRNNFTRPTIQPIRFDFLPVPELGMAVRHSKDPNTIGIFIPLGHFEITETSFMHTTQFEYDANVSKVESPLILNGGHFEQIVVRYGSTNNNGLSNRTSYILMGGHFRMLRFTPGAHTSKNSSPTIRLCAVNAIGGEYPEFYLSGIYRPDIVPSSLTDQGNPHCYTNGGRFGSMNGAGYDKILGSVTFKIDHSVIDEFNGGGINAANPIGGSIDVTIDHSLVSKYCGGPKVGTMTNGTTVTTHATGTTFGQYYGGGNGGTSYYREQGYDGNDYDLPTSESGWIGTGNTLGGKAKYKEFNPLNTLSGTKYYDDTKGYNALFEFECFAESNGLGGKPTLRTYTHWAQFGTTSTGNITNDLNDCTIKESFYGGGNLGNVSGNVTSTLTDCTIQGDVFGGGYSGRIEPFRIHDKSQKVIPYADNSGIIYNVDLPYVKDGNDYRYYTWCYKNPTTGEMFPEGVIIPGTVNTNNPTFQYNGKWYVLTTVSLENLGSVSGTTTLNLKGSTVVGSAGNNTTGNVYGGGSESAVEGDTNVNICAVQDETDPTKYLPVTGESLIIHGNVFGGGKGKADEFTCSKAMVGVLDQGVIDGVLQSGGTKVIIGNGTVEGDVYGGGEVGRVERNTQVMIGLEEETSEPVIKGSVYGAGAGRETHGYSALVRGNTEVTIQGEATVKQSVYGGGKIASVGRFDVVGGLPAKPKTGGTCTVTIQGKAKIGSGGSGDVFGSCKGVEPTYSYTTSSSYDDRINNSKSMQTFENKPDGDEGETWDYYKDADGNKDERYVWEYFTNEDAYLDFLKTLALASNPTVTIRESATVYGDVYGGGQRGITLGDVNVNIAGGTVNKDVYGGGALADTNKGNWNENNYEEATELNTGESLTDLYTRTGDSEPYKYKKYTGTETNISSGTYYRHVPTWASDKYNSTTYATFYKTNVTLTGGTIKRNVYGGGLGQIGRDHKDAVEADPEHGIEAQEEVTKLDDVQAKVYGDVLVTLNGTPVVEGGVITSYTPNGTCVVQGDIFGCNNQNGSPQSAVTVHVYKTQGWLGHDVTEGKNNVTIEKTGSTYELSAVYGGGNLSAFYPDLKATRDTVQTRIIIDGCDLTSIEQVYGGGNAASTPATNVTINNVYEIGEVFGGGNGLDDIIVNGETKDNPGANVGYTAYDPAYDPPASSAEERTTKFGYGSGKASVNIYGGTIHRVFGGSNTKGNVRQTTITLLDNQDPCVLDIDEAYGGGRSAPMDAEAKLLMACIPGLKAAYGGAQAADVQNNVVLNITNGTFDRVFGGNNLSGTISGSITVNIEETGCVPLIIGELYGGGNLAPYSVYGYDEDGNPIEHNATKKYADPQINVKSFTSIGNIYGGGYGTGAVMYGDPTVNINVTEGKYKEYVGVTSLYGDDYDYDANGYKGNPNKMIDGHKVVIPPHKAGSIGAIQNVFGGGNAAAVVGSTRVNVGTTSKEYVTVPDNDIEVGVTDVSTLFTRTGEGTSVSPFVYTVVGTSGSGAGKAEEGVTYYKECAVKGADIKGNVYGGGNQAKVSGSTNVTIGKETTTTP